MQKGLLFIVLLFFALGLNAQEIPEQRFEAGLIAGFNMSQLDGDDLIGFHKIGINTGGRVSARLSKRLRLNMEMLFSQQGSSYATTDNPSAPIDKIKLNFVEAPVFLSYEEWRFHAYTGASYGRLFDYYVEEITGADVTDITEYTPDIFTFFIGTTFYFNEKWGLDIRWSKYLNSLRAEVGSEALLGRTISIRGIYLL